MAEGRIDIFGYRIDPKKHLPWQYWDFCSSIRGNIVKTCAHPKANPARARELLRFCLSHRLYLSEPARAKY
jgi:hypothetical protein